MKGYLGFVAVTSILLLNGLGTVVAATERSGYSRIEDIESFKEELEEPIKSYVAYGLSGLRGLKDGYFY